jgi:hypothetical protein
VPSDSKPRVFISYAHADAEWKDRLATHLGVLDDELVTWHDGEISAGDDWLGRIRAQLDAAAVAVFLVSAASLTSPFIRDVELKRLLDRRRREGLRIVPVLVKPCAWERVSWLAGLQHRPVGRELSGGSEHQIDTDLAAIAVEIADLVHATRAEPGSVADLDAQRDAAIARGDPTSVAALTARKIERRRKQREGVRARRRNGAATAPRDARRVCHRTLPGDSGAVARGGQAAQGVARAACSPVALQGRRPAGRERVVARRRGVLRAVVGEDRPTVPPAERGRVGARGAGRDDQRVLLR